jgi:tetratricopeptide (TPR) repeat protein
MAKSPSKNFGSILGSASRDVGGALRLFAYALLVALALCDSAWCVDAGSAKDRYARALHDAEQQYGPTDSALIEPLVGLADALIAAGQPADAIEPLTRAVGILRRNSGLYEQRQYALLSQLTELHSLQGDVDSAVAVLGYMERVSERADGRQSLQHAHSLAAIAAWYCRLGRFDSGRERFRRSIARLRTNDDEQLIDALLGLTRCSFDELAAESIATSPDSLESYRGPVLLTSRISIGSPTFQHHVQKIMRPEAEQAVRYAAQLAETVTLLPQRRVEVLLQAGDWFQAKDHSRTARRYYASAQRWLKHIESADDPFAAPVQVLYPVPTLALSAPSTNARYVEAEFTVRADGHIDSGRMITNDLGRSAADETLQALQVARFRPRMVEDTAVDTPGVRFRQAFK